MNHARSFAAVLLMALTAGAARAEDAGFYLGAGVGEASQDAEGFHGKDTSFTVFGGYSFNAYLAAEAGYIDAGKQTDHQGGLDLAVRSDGFLVAGLVKIPLGRYVAPYAKLGYAFYDARTSVSAGTQSVSATESDEDLVYGLGCEFKIGENLRLRAEYEKVDVSDADFDIASLNLAWQF